MASLLGFPDTVNDKAARVVAGVVAATGLVVLLTGSDWLLVPLALGFLARVLSGPRIDPLARFAVHVAAPRLGPPRISPGPPKRFAQAVGLALSTAAAVLALVTGQALVADVLVAVLVVFATLEAVVGFCAGCWVFARLMRLGLVPERTCVACADIWSRA